jgi:hypothetical protein
MRPGAALLWTVVLGFLLLGTIATLPWLFRDGGWFPIAACAAWSACIPGTLYLVIRFAPRRLTKAESAQFGMFLIVVTILIGMLIAPAAAIAFLYGPEAATGASYVSGLIGVGGIVTSALVYNWRSQRETAKHNRFYARFKDGPVGVWRGVRLGFGRVEEGCGIVFNPDSAGHFRLWEGAENETTAPPTTFRWRRVGENLIEVRLDGDGSLKKIEFIIPYTATKAVKLMLRLPGIELPDIVPSEVGFAEFDNIHWPRYLFFDHLGEPPAATVAN